LPHCFANAPAQALALSPVVLADDGLGPGGVPLGVLVNLGAAMPQAFARHPRVIEVVSLDEDDRQQARQRWKTYTARGFAIDRKDLNLRS
jgi:DNA polymerase-3 subunit chi